MVATFDHLTGAFSKPVCVFDKWCADPHDNPAIQIDPDGYVWLFSPSHGEWTTRSFIHKSRRPYEIDDWVTVSDSPLFAYPQPWVDPEFGWMFLHTEYHHGRGLRFKSSPDGVGWTDSVPLVDFGKGHYQVSWFDPELRLLGMAFDMHPETQGLDGRTNLYFLQSRDGGEHWEAAAGTPVALPVTDAQGPALVQDYHSSGNVVYLRDLKYTLDGRPVILYVISGGFEPGPQHGPHQWQVALWEGGQWKIRDPWTSDNNYDHGELWMEAGRWRVIAPSGKGPQPYNPGGEMEIWSTGDEGHSWTRDCALTTNSP